MLVPVSHFLALHQRADAGWHPLLPGELLVTTRLSTARAVCTSGRRAWQVWQAGQRLTGGRFRGTVRTECSRVQYRGSSSTAAGTTIARIQVVTYPTGGEGLREHAFLLPLQQIVRQCKSVTVHRHNNSTTLRSLRARMLHRACRIT